MIFSLIKSNYFFIQKKKIITISKLISSEPLKNKASGGYDDYEYPQWSTILGWFIFIACIIPIPIVYIVNYIKEFKAIRLSQIVKDYNSFKL